jgi:hypothetical protein
VSVRRQYVALALAAAAVFVALGGPAYAAKAVKQISGSSIKPKSITSKQLADGSVSLAKLAASARTALKGPPGTPGAPGDAGPTGSPGELGARGPATVNDVVDRTGRRIGRDLGLLAAYQAVLTDEGAILAYQGNVADPNPIPLVSGPLYFKVANCQGQAYLANAGVPPEMGVILAAPPVPGSPIWVAQPAAYESFTAASSRGAGACTNGSAAVTGALPARTAGTVPALQKPLLLKAAG